MPCKPIESFDQIVYDNKMDMVAIQETEEENS